MASLFRRFFFVMILNFSLSLNVFCQTDIVKAKVDTLVLSDSLTLSGKIGVLKEDGFSVILNDTARYSLSDVNRFSCAEDWFYVKHKYNLVNGYAYNEDKLAKRIYKGRISLFENYSLKKKDSEDRDYFTVDDYLRDYNYDNLSYFLTKEERCRKVLGDYERLKYTRNVILVASLIFTSYAIYETTKNFPDEGFKINPLMYIGLGGFGLSFIPQVYANRKLDEAVDIYNGLR